MNEFDSKAFAWDADANRVDRARAVAQGIRAGVSLTPQDTALEYGCGTGLLSFALQPFLGHITLADSSGGMLAVVAEKIAAQGMTHMTPLSLDLLAGPLPPARYRLIYTLMTLHHIPDTAAILGAFYALLEEGGSLCVADLDREDGSFHGPGFEGHPGFERAALGEQARRAGFRRVQFETIFHMPRRVGEEMRSYPLFLMIAGK
ncbi:MAG: class I SAM-dependent methyltransferase [Chloroflexi bacterium]|nr:class I SAM-dependent methyltransferase [Chloroflexota bacterium]